MFYTLLWLLGLVFTLIKARPSVLVGSEFIVPDLITALILYVFLVFGHAGSFIFALGQGYFMDLFSGGMQGLFTFLYLSVFGCILLSSKFFNLYSARGQVTIIGLVMLLKSVLFSISLTAFSQRAVFPVSFPWISALVAIITGITTPVIFYLFDILKAIRFDKS